MKIRRAFKPAEGKRLFPNNADLVVGEKVIKLEGNLSTAEPLVSRWIESEQIVAAGTISGAPHLARKYLSSKSAKG